MTLINIVYNLKDSEIETGYFKYFFAADREDLWPGLTRKTAACTLQNRPTQIPDNSGPPCLDDTSYCALFEGHCQADIWGGPATLNTQGGANQVNSLTVRKSCTQKWIIFITH